MELFGKKMRILRERQGMTQKELAQQLGFSRDHVSSLETGRKIPHARLVVRIADLFGVTTDVLMRDDLELDDGEDAA
jgi:transcriptional regulator with XRE-family HTH domain